MPLSTNRTTFTFNNVGQPDELGASVGDYTIVQADMDSRAVENLTDINNIKSTLISETIGDSGAHNIKSAGIAGLLSGVASTVYAMLSALKSYIDTASANFQAGIVLDGSIEDVKLSNAAGQIKDTVNTHLSENRSYLVNVKYPPMGYTAAKGDGITDDTLAINAIVQYTKTNKCGGIYFPDSSGAYMINGNDPLDPIYYSDNGGILIDSPMKIVLHPNAVLKAITSDKNGYNIINIKNATNVTIEGGTILGERTTHIGTIGEHGFGISVRNSSKVYIKDITTQDCWGDGVFTGSTDGYPTTYSQDIFLSNVISRNNRRQGLSIVSVKRIYINDCEFSETNGTLPESGIDMEANAGYPDNEDIFINNCRFNLNNKSDIIIATIAKRVSISNCITTGCKSISICVPIGATVDGLTIDGVQIDMANSVTGAYGIYLGGTVNKGIITSNIIENVPSIGGAGISAIAQVGLTLTNNHIGFCDYGISFDGASSSHITTYENEIHDVKEGIYAHAILTNSSIDENDMYNITLNGINAFANMSNVSINNNNFKDAQRCGIRGDISECKISGNKFKDMGKEGAANAYPSIELNSTVADNFIISNKVRNAITGHISIRNNVTPAKPNIVSKNDFRYAVAAQVLVLNAADVNDGNFTL